VSELQASPPEGVRISRLSALSGFLSVALLAASFRWAHHWGARTDALVSGWILTTLTALFVSPRLLWREEVRPGLPRIGLAGGLISVVALAVVALLYAVGINPTGVCGGG
jgi:hypothetical protein